LLRILTNPEVPLEPEAPEEPEVPLEPEAPEEPDVPLEPEAPSFPFKTHEIVYMASSVKEPEPVIKVSPISQYEVLSVKDPTV